MLHFCIFLLLVLSAFFCQANENTISIGVAHFPPYSIVDEDGISGVEVDIVRESLSIMGYEVRFKSYPYGRLPTAFKSKKVNGTIVTLKNFNDINVYYSDIVLPEYQTVAVNLKEKPFNISTIADLQNKTIIAHQRANLFYGNEFKRIADLGKKTEQYKETARQDSQVLMFFRDRVDVIVLAHEIFIYFKNRASYKEAIKPYKVSKIFGNKFGFFNVFWNKKIRDDFNIGLSLIKENGTYNQLLRKYLKKYDVYKY